MSTTTRQCEYFWPLKIISFRTLLALLTAAVMTSRIQCYFWPIMLFLTLLQLLILTANVISWPCTEKFFATAQWTSLSAIWLDVMFDDYIITFLATQLVKLVYNCLNIKYRAKIKETRAEVSNFYEFRLRLNIKRISKPESFGKLQVRKRKYLKADREGRGVLHIQMIFS